jgi:hemerythrin superfamily protein
MSDLELSLSRRRFAVLGSLVAAGAAVAPSVILPKEAAAQQPAAGDAFQTLIEDHRKVDQMLQQISATEDTQKRMTLVRQLADALTRHAVAEENVIYPAVRQKSLTGLDAMTAVKDHADIKTYLYVLQNTTDKAEWQEQFDALKEEVKAHVEQEESDMFPALRAELSAEELAKMTQAVTREMGLCKA